MEKQLSKKVLNKSFWLWFYGNLTCFSQEHMQTFGYLSAMLPICQELYANEPEKLARSMKTYTAFFNTEPQIGAVVVGVTAGLEQARANGEPVDDETINGLRAGLMGPLAGIGDSLIVGTVIPILLGIALGLASGGSVIGPLFYIVTWNLFAVLGMRFIYFKGYQLGGKAVEILVGEKAQAIRESIQVVGAMVIGAVAASWINVSTAYKMFDANGEVIVDLNNSLNSVYPKLLTAATVVICWWLMSKRKISPTKVMGILVIVAFIGVLIGFFDPGLQY